MSCIWRWARRGIKSRNGKIIRLSHRRIGARLFTTRAALDEFFKRLTEADFEYFDSQDPHESTRHRQRTAKQRSQGQEDAMKVLEQAKVTVSAEEEQSQGNTEEDILEQEES